MNRRGFLGGLIFAPFVVKSQSIMPVKLFIPEPITPVYDPVLISLVKRYETTLMAYDICGAQPMTREVGEIFSLKARYA